MTAYGVHPDLAQYSNGLQIIMLSRRLMWPMIAIALLASIALFALVIGGKRRIWWLIGLAPLMAMFVHRFSPGPGGATMVNESPIFVGPADNAVPEAGDFIVGVVFNSHAFALPYRALFATPVVTLTDFDQRLMVIWSAYANRAVAVKLKRDLRPRDFEIVSTPANSLLILDRRLGQFISGVTGRRVDGSEVIGFAGEVPVEKMPWSAWKSKHPESAVMVAMNAPADAPTRPILPQFHTGGAPAPDPALSIAILATTRPVAIPDEIASESPANITVGDARVLIARDRNHDLVAFDRHAKEDLFLTFEKSAGNKLFPDALLTDVDTHSLWTIEGRAVNGALKGQVLKSIQIDQGLYWGVMKYWYPHLQLMRN